MFSVNYDNYLSVEVQTYVHNLYNSLGLFSMIKNISVFVSLA